MANARKYWYKHKFDGFVREVKGEKRAFNISFVCSFVSEETQFMQNSYISFSYLLVKYVSFCTQRKQWNCAGKLQCSLSDILINPLTAGVAYIRVFFFY